MMADTSTHASAKAPRRPACDHCKERKTKCDRGNPCSSCSAAGLTCRLTRNASTERRQRILISAKYDEAIENIDRQLGQIFDTLQSLGEQNRRQMPPSSTASTRVDPPSALQGTPSSDGFRGEYSFNGQLESVLNALESVVSGSNSPSNPWAITRQLRSEVLSPLSSTTSLDTPSHTTTTASQQDSVKKDCELPPIDLILNILRLTQTKRQRFFVDAYIIDEAEFSALCQQVFFAVHPYSSTVWSIVNVGLLFLLEGLDQADGQQMGLNPERVVAYVDLLKSNVNAAIDDIRVSSESTVRDCQALALLVTFCMKSGQLEKAWKLNCTASRMCMDLGLHRMTGDSEAPEPVTQRRVFGYIYIWDKNMAFALGRPPCIPAHEVTTKQPTHPKDVPGIPGKIYSKFVDYTFLAAEVHQQLFTAAGQALPSHIRVEHATAFISRQETIQGDLRNIIRNDADSWGSRMFGAAGLVEITLSFLATILWQIIPSDSNIADGSQYHSRCVQAARGGLSTFIKLGETAKEVTPRGWSLFANLILCATPFVPFLVIVSNAVTSRNLTDLPLLLSAVELLKPLASSPNAGPIFRTCSKLYDVAQSLVPGGASFEHVMPDASFAEPSDAVHEDTSIILESRGLDLLTNNVDSTLAHDWSTFVDLFGGQGDAESHSELEPYEHAPARR